MKKILSLIVIASAFIACSSNKYTIKGQIEGLEDGEYVTISDINGGSSLVPFDSIAVSDGKYSFEGETDTSDVCILSFEIDGEMHTCTFFLEPGRIEVSYVDGQQKVGGTPSNDGFQKFYDQVQNLNDKAEDLQTRIQQASAEGREIDSYKDEMEGLQDQYTKIVSESILSNADNTFGMQQLLDSYSMFEPEQLAEFITALEAKFAGNEYLAQLKEMTDLKLKTAVGSQYIDAAAHKDGVSGESVNFSEYVGKSEYVLIDFWASWCGPCRREIPYMKEAYAKYTAKGFEILSVSVDQDEADWKEALAEEGMAWPQLIDAQDADDCPAYLYGISTIPSNFLVDKDGKIVARDLRGAGLEEKLAELLK